MNLRAMIVPIAVVASLGLAACGGDDDKELSKSDLAKKANAICKDTQKKTDDLKQPDNLARDPVAAAAYFEKALPIAENQLEKFEDLKPDDDAKADWNQFVARQKQGTELVKTLRDKAKAKDVSGVADLAKLQRVGGKFSAEAAAVGADTCGSGG